MSIRTVTSVTAILAITLLVMTVQTASASSYVGSFADGYELGKKHGEKDYESYRHYDADPDPYDKEDSWWFRQGYKAGYAIGWGAAKVLDD